MGKKTVITAREAVMAIKDGETLAISSFLSYGLPETLCKALGERYAETKSPKNLTLFMSAPVGVNDGSGVEHLAQEGLFRRLYAAHLNLHPTMSKMAVEGAFEAYNLPQGVMSRMCREMAAHSPGIFTHVGLHTFADPRIDGCKINARTTEDMVEVVKIEGKEYLHYKPIPMDAAFIRGSYADEMGNISVENEGVSIDILALAQAVHNNGGKVFVQVEKIVPAGSLDPWKVKIPGMLVDYLVLPDEPEEQVQSRAGEFDASLCGKGRKDDTDYEPVPLDAKKIIGRRAAMELKKDIVVNLGIGVAEYVSKVAREEGFTDIMTLTVESGAIGGAPLSGKAFGANVNVDLIIDQPNMFDLYDGGGLDQAYLGLAQVDKDGNVNVSRFNGRLAGCGGFIDITQNSRRVHFCGTFTTGGLKIGTGNGELRITQEGKNKKFIRAVDQITFSARYACQSNQPVLFITERAVFRLAAEGLELIEIAPGIDLQKDILAQMDFEPKISSELKLMDARIFRDEKMGLIID